MTKLDAINEVLEAAKEFPVAALDTGGTSMPSLAEVTLDRWDLRIQARGWHQNHEANIALVGRDLTKMAMSHADFVWDASELTLTKAAAFTSYTFAGGDTINVTAGTGVTAAYYEIYERISANAIRLTSSIATADNADTTTTLIGWENAIELPAAMGIIRLDSWPSSYSGGLDVVVRDEKIYDRRDNTFSFANGLVVEWVRQLAWTDMQEELAAYIVAAAAREFQAVQIGGRVTDAFLYNKYVLARGAAFDAEADSADHNVLKAARAHQIKGTAQVTQSGRA